MSVSAGRDSSRPPAAEQSDDRLTTRGGRYAFARRRLAGAQKSTVAVPAYLRYVNRRLGGHLACIAYALGLTPSAVSGLSMLFSCAGLALLALAPSTVAVGMAVAIATAFGYALDSADGQLARVRGGGSLAGEWLDHVLDIIKTATLHSCVLIALFRHFDIDRAILLIPLVFLLAQTTGFFSNMLRDALRRQSGLPAQPPSTRSSLQASLVLLPFDHGTLCWVFILLGWHAAFLCAYISLAVLCTLFTARALLRTHAGLSALDSGIRT